MLADVSAVVLIIAGIMRVFVDDPDDVPEDATPFDMRGGAVLVYAAAPVCSVPRVPAVAEGADRAVSLRPGPGRGSGRHRDTGGYLGQCSVRRV